MMNEKTCRLWLPFLGETAPAACDAPRRVAEYELKAGCAALGRPAPALVEDADMGEAYAFRESGIGTEIVGGPTGLLYGAYAWLEAAVCGEPLPEGTQKPFYGLRMLNCWDDASGDIERGYAGRSLWFEGGRMAWDDGRVRQLARALASTGINVLCLNNVNVRDEAALLIEDYLPDLARLAAVFRPYGVRLMVSVDFARPVAHGLDTADPLDENVQRWWRECADAVWQAVPDLAGFLVEADSEHRPGPFTYGRSHAEGANMLARAVAPHGGVLVWRAFVYNCQQD